MLHISGSLFVIFFYSVEIGIERYVVASHLDYLAGVVPR